MPEFTLSVNSQRRTVNVPAEMPLLWVLRDTLALTGTKYGCGMALCGACTVLLAAAALLERTPRPSDAEVDEAMTNICRCGTYQRIRSAIHRAAGEV